LPGSVNGGVAVHSPGDAPRRECPQGNGVKRVVNDLQVMIRAKEATVKVRDEDIESDVKKAFGKADFKDIGASALAPGCARGQGRSPARDS
jgi:hypothetical protein